MTLHPEKTRLVRFRRPKEDGVKPGTFDFLGFTHHWAKTTKGTWAVKRQTSRKRLARTIRRINEWCKRQRHDTMGEQHKVLVRKLAGHYAYYGLPWNRRSLEIVRQAALQLWHKWLSRRSQRGSITWDRYHRLLAAYPLPRPG